MTWTITKRCRMLKSPNSKTGLALSSKQSLKRSTRTSYTQLVFWIPKRNVYRLRLKDWKVNWLVASNIWRVYSVKKAKMAIQLLSLTSPLSKARSRRRVKCWSNNKPRLRRCQMTGSPWNLCLPASPTLRPRSKRWKIASHSSCSSLKSKLLIRSRLSYRTTTTLWRPSLNLWSGMPGTWSTSTPAPSKPWLPASSPYSTQSRQQRCVWAWPN